MVSTATQTALTVAVPGGATSGKIAVSNAAGSATSATDFLVSGVSAEPVIVAFTPQVGTLNTVVTLTGTNFQARVEDDKVLVGGQLAAIVQDASSPTVTQLKFRVPSTTASGTISLTTQFGKAVSATEFIAVPTTVNPADVEFISRFTVDGPAVTVTTTANGKKAALLFDGTAGAGLHVRAQNGTFASGTIANVYAPNGTPIETLFLANNNVADFAKQLTLAGTHLVILNPTASDKGSVQLSLIGDVGGTIALNTPTPVSLGAGQNARLTFTGQAGTGYGLAIAGLAFTPTAGGGLQAILRKADGTFLTNCVFNFAGSCDLSPNLFATTGTYLLDFDPAGVNAASFNAILSADALGSLALDAAPAAVTIARAGQNARYSFSGTAGQIVTVVLTANALDDGNTSTNNNTTISIHKPSSPNGAPVGIGVIATKNSSLTFDVLLPETGNYTMLFNPAGLDSGSINTQVKSYATGVLTLDGSTPVSLSGGQNGRFTFTAQANTGYGLAITGLNFTPPSGGSLQVLLRKADGTPLTNVGFTVAGSVDLEPNLFAATGTYLLDFDPAGVNAASFDAVLSTDVTGSVAIDASAPTAVTTARPGQNARYTFSGTTGQLVTVVLTGSTIDDGNAATSPSTQVLVSRPNNAVIATGALNAISTTTTIDVALPDTGTYTVALKPAGLDSGSVNLQMKSFVTGPVTLDTSTPVSLSSGQNARFSFTGLAGTGYGLAVTGLGFTPSPGTMAFTLRRADGTPLGSVNFGVSGSIDLDPNLFPTTGTYFLDFDPPGLTAASFNVVPSTDASGTITVDAPSPTTVTIARPGQNARYTFSGTAGQQLNVVFSGKALDDGNPGTLNGTQVLVFKPSNNVTAIANATIAPSQTGVTLNVTLPETGSYTVAIKPAGLDSGSVNVRVSHP